MGGGGGGSLISDSETIEVVIFKLGTVTASDMVMHHMLIILITLRLDLHSR